MDTIFTNGQLTKPIETMRHQQMTVAVNYGQSLEQMIVAGHYDWVHNDITVKFFQIVGEGIIEFEIRLFHFDRVISLENALEDMKNADTTNSWEPAKIEHVLSFGAKYPQEQRDLSNYRSIIGLGSVADVGGARSMPVLDGGSSWRYLNLYWFGGVWLDVRFLAVRKLLPSTT